MRGLNEVPDPHNVVATSVCFHQKKEKKDREKESQRIVFVIKLTRMGLINLCESIKRVL